MAFRGSGPGAVAGGQTPPPLTTDPTRRTGGTGAAGGAVSAPPRTNSGNLPGSTPQQGGFTQTPIRTPGSGIPAGTAVQSDQAQRDSYAILTSVLASYGLESLAPTVLQWLVQGLSEAEIMQQMRETKEYKDRFPAMKARQDAGLPAMNEAEYINYERAAFETMRAAGLPSGFYDSVDDFTNYMINNVSISELADRITLASNAAFRMTPQERQALADFGVTSPGDLTALWLDPDKSVPLLERKYAAAQLAGASSQAGFGRLNETEATGLVQQGIGREQALAGFTDLTDQRELFTALDGGEDMIGRQDQLDATFSGNAAQRRRIEQRARRRQATFAQGGGFAAGQDGLVGLDDTRR